MLQIPGRRAAAALLMLACAACSDTGKAGGTASAAIPPETPPPFTVERSAVHTISSQSLGRTYEVYVKTPPGYDKPENAARRYPVIYLTDGPYTFQVASGVSRVPFNQRKLEEFILVGLSYAEGEEPRASRSRDLTPYPNPAMSAPTGGARAYLDHIKDEVLPLVEGRYRIDPARRVLSGQSYGGLFGLWVALTEPELFSAYILTSPSIWFADRSLLKTEAAYAATHRDLKATIYLAIGALERPGGCPTCTSDMVGDQAELVKRLRARAYPGLRLRSDVVPGTIHEMTYPVGLVHGLQWLFPAPKTPEPAL